MPAPPAAARARRRDRAWVPRAAQLLCALIGLINIGSGSTPALKGRIRLLTEVVPGTAAHAAAAATIVAGLLLLLLAHALRRQKRRAWRMVVLLLAASVVLHLVKGLDIEEAVVSAALLAGLVHYRDEFRAVGDPSTRLRAVVAFVVLGCLSVGLGLIVIDLQTDDIAGAPGVLTWLHQVGLGLFGISGPLRFTDDRASDLVGFTLPGLGLLTALVTAYLALRPPEPAPHLDAEDERRMRALLDQHGARDSLGYFALRRDKSVIWSTTGKAAIAYRVVSGVMLASGDPLGDPEAWPGAISRFVQEARRHAWVPAVVGCSELGGEVWSREAGLDALELGDEAVVELSCFGLEGRRMRNVRQAVGRVERAGYTQQVRRLRELSPEQRRELAQQAAAWRGSETERGFSMALGRFGDPADGDCVVATATLDGVLRAFLHFVPWGSDGLSLDLMRRDRTADNGLNEYLIVSALRESPRLGVTRMSLNFAVFRSAFERGERLGAGPVLRAWRGLLLFVSRWFQIESLYRFNAKFAPVWEPRFLCFRSAGDLPRVALAALEAEAFIVWPRPSIRRIRALARARTA